MEEMVKLEEMVNMEEMAYPEFKDHWAPKVKLANPVYPEPMVQWAPKVKLALKDNLETKETSDPVAILA